MLFLNIISFLLHFIYQFEHPEKVRSANVISRTSVFCKKEGFAPPTTYYWIGITFDFQDPNNWLPVRTSSSNSDILIFDSSSPTLSKVLNVPSQTIGQLIIKDSRQVNFEGINAVTAFSISGLSGDDLYIETGSTFKLNSANAIELNILPGANANIYGKFITSSINLTQPNHRLYVADPGACLFQNGAFFIAEALTDNPFGTTIPTNTVIFKPGSTYISQAGANPFGFTSPSQSKVIFEKGSLYSQQQLTGLSLAGRTYADFDLNVGNGINFLVLAGSSGSTCKIDNLHIVSGNFKFPLNFNNNGLNINLYGDLILETGASFNYSPTNPMAFSTFIIKGNIPQNISGNISFGNKTIVSIENSNPGSNDINLNSNIDCNGYLFLKNGIINTGVNYIYAADISPTYSGDNNTHINGNLRRNVLAGTLQHFPVGDGTHYQKAEIISDCAGVYSSKYSSINPNSSVLNAFTENSFDFNEALPDGFWSLSSVTCSNANYEIHLFPNGFASYPNARLAYTIAKRDVPGNWLKDGNLFNLENKANLVQSNFSIQRRIMKGFSDFAIVAPALSPLPLNIFNFKIENINSEIFIKWVSTEEESIGFEIEKSLEGKNFNTIAFIKFSKENNGDYIFKDQSPSSNAYYRLKNIGKYNSIYSKIIKYDALKTPILSINIWPNPVNNDLEIDFSSSEKAFINMKGPTGISIFQEENRPEILKVLLRNKILSLPAGIYFLETIQNGRIYFNKIVKI